MGYACGAGVVGGSGLTGGVGVVANIHTLHYDHKQLVSTMETLCSDTKIGTFICRAEFYRFTGIFPRSAHSAQLLEIPRVYSLSAACVIGRTRLCVQRSAGS